MERNGKGEERLEGEPKEQEGGRGGGRQTCVSVCMYDYGEYELVI